LLRGLVGLLEIPPAHCLIAIGESRLLMDVLPPALFIVLALVAFGVAGALLVWVIGYVRSGARRRADEGAASATARAEPGAAARPGDGELLCVSRTKRGRLDVIVQGRHYRHLREISDPQVGQETVSAINAVMAFAEGWLPESRQNPPHSDEDAAVRPVSDGRGLLREPEQRDPPPVSTSSGLFGRPRRRRSPATRQLLLTPADEIDQLVQDRLAQRPEFGGQQVRLATGDDGGIRFHVGGRAFAAVDEIPDPDLQALIRDAIREWGDG